MAIDKFILIVNLKDVQKVADKDDDKFCQSEE